MLKRLELIGFKSFADKTEFCFADGITAIVGPNGSGKSNVVDAVRWVLGEQSAKSLRGGEMAEVIFNGSASRRSPGLAEVTMTFDNSRRALATEADEAHITRRGDRGGQGQDLITRQVCRLKELRVALGFQEVRKLSERLSEETQKLDVQRAALQADGRQAEAWEQELRQMEEALGHLDAAVAGHESALAGARQQIAAEETT